jgi:hypothetical protein
MSKKPCAVCGVMFSPRYAHEKYHGPACRAVGKALSNAAYDAQRGGREYAEAREALAVLQRTPQPQRTVLRARTLADTPDVPAITAERGDYVTGGAAATMQATSGGRIGVV